MTPTTASDKTLIILNPHAGGGRARRLWTQLEPLLWEKLGELVIAVTERPDEVAPHLDYAYASGIRRVISVGGDGTNHALINALVGINERHAGEPPMIYGSLPVGTGQDWARGAGVPYRDFKAAAQWIAEAQPRPTDIGLLQRGGGPEYFLNIASVGMSGEVAVRVNRQRARRPWAFLAATVATILHHRPRRMRVALDGKAWYDGLAYLAAVANGSTFGRGMKIAPDAEVRDGLFDVVLVEGVSRLRLLAALGQVYTGAHVRNPAVHVARAGEVRITGDNAPFEMELDGEFASGHDLTFRIQPGLLRVLA